MKQIIGNGPSESYTFTAATNTVTITGPALTVESLLLINNPTRETIIYNPFSSGRGYTSFTSTTTAVGTVTTIVLEYDTSSFNDADKLQIFYDNSNSASVEIGELALQLKKLFYKLEMMPINQSVANFSGVPRVQAILTTDSSMNQISSITTVRGLGTNTADAGQGVVDPLMDLTFNNQIRNRITVS